MSTRRKYRKEFKLDAISLVTEESYSCPEAEKSLGINPNMLSRWIRESTSDDEQAFRGNGKLTVEQLDSSVTRRSQTRDHGERTIKKGHGTLCQ